MDAEKEVCILESLLERDNESLLGELKKIASNIELDQRQNFEHQLLTLAQGITDTDKRNTVYEVLVSLKAIWNKNKPEKELLSNFQLAFENGDYKEAEKYYRKLARQGLHYLGTFPTDGGKIIPVVTGNNDFLLQFSKKKFNIYSLSLTLLKEIYIREFLDIVNVHAPIAHQATDDIGTEEMKKIVGIVWILLEANDGKKVVVSIDTKSIDAVKLAFENIPFQSLCLETKLSQVRRLSYFQNHLLLIDRSTIYYQENEQWKEWYKSSQPGNRITCFEPTRNGFWIGHSNGDIIILKSLQYVGVRETIKGFSNPIKNIRGSGRLVLIYDQNRLIVTDYNRQPVLKPITLNCTITQARILDENIILLLMTNGMLVGRELKQGNIRWQVNLGDTFEYLRIFQQYIYCKKSNGEIDVFEVPPFGSMAEKLSSKSIYVEEVSVDAAPNDPVSDISGFIGRRGLLEEIKEATAPHFLLYGEPRIGKTSLLNVLKDTLSEKAKYCIVDAVLLYRDIGSYDIFIQRFIDTCLEQHLMKQSDLPGKDGYTYQTLRAMIYKIKGDRSHCVFGIDNFFIPNHFDKSNLDAFDAFLLSMLIHPNVRLIITCSGKDKDEIDKYFKDFKRTSARQSIHLEKISLLTELKVKNALRKKISIKQPVVEKIYQCIGRFPHLIHLYDKWDIGDISFENYTNQVAKTYSEQIFDYFRDLSLDAFLLIATCLFENLVSKKISYTYFYDQFPFLKSSLPKERLKHAVEELSVYGSGILALQEKDSFYIAICDNAHLFMEAAQHISWLKDVKVLYAFTSLADQYKAHNVALIFTRITGSELDSNKRLDKINKKFKDKFYTGKLTESGIQTLEIPLTTFIVIPLKPWRQDLYAEAFRDLNTEFQEFNRKIGGTAGQMFYVLLFELYGVTKGKIKEALKGFDRISVIDAEMMKNIILADTPKEKASEYIFGQLSIKERSPYTTAGAVPDNLFFGRQMELALIRGLPENIGVFGTRTIGKSSLLRKLRKTFKEQKQWKVYDMDCSRIDGEESFLKHLAEKMDIPFRHISNMEKFRKYITAKAESGNYRYLFLLDEVDRLVQWDCENEESIFNTFNRLYTEAMVNDETAARFILFGFQEMFEQMKNPLSRLYNFMVFLPLKPLEWDDAIKLVTIPMSSIRVKWDRDEDAEYLVDSCSCHPRLMQSACNALLANLDSKKERRDIIERFDVDIALASPDFREICMRFYHDPGVVKKSGEVKKMSIFSRPRHSTPTKDEKVFLGDLHRITILAAIRLVYGEQKERFTVTDIHAELKSYGIDVGPNVMRNVLDRLCLSGNFSMKEEFIMVAKEGEKVLDKAQSVDKNDRGKLTNLSHAVERPDTYKTNDSKFPLFTFEFGVRIYPRLLVAYFGGFEKCEEECGKLVEKGAWKEWLRRYS